MIEDRCSHCGKYADVIVHCSVCESPVCVACSDVCAECGGVTCLDCMGHVGEVHEGVCSECRG